MRFISFLIAIAFMLPLRAVSDEDLRSTDELRKGLQTGGLKGSSPAHRAENEADQGQPSRQLTWGKWWSYKKKGKKRKEQTFHSFYTGNNNNNNPAITTPTSCNCKEKTKKFDLTGFIGNALVAADDVSEVGGKYIYNTPLAQDAALTEEFDGTSFFTSGDCTRIQGLEVDGASRLLGAGLCTFIVSVITPRARGSMTIHGELFDVIPSTFAITGGTEDFDGARGNVVFTPFYDDGGTDVFTEASHVEVDVNARILD